MANLVESVRYLLRDGLLVFVARLVIATLFAVCVLFAAAVVSPVAIVLAIKEALSGRLVPRV